MNGKAPRRPRESKKEAVCLCSHGGMRKCPRSVSNLSEGGQGTFSRRGKASQRRSSHRRARPRLHGPTRGYMEEKGEQRERRKSKGEAWFGEAWIKHLPLSSDPHHHHQRHLLPPYTPHPQSCSESACVSFCKALLLLHLLLLLLLPLPA